MQIQAIKTISNGRAIYQCSVTFHELDSILAVSPDKEYQRTLNLKRVESFFDYLYLRIKRKELYTIPNLIGCFLSEDSHLLDYNHGTFLLSFPEIYRFSCVDGQHRMAGIRQLLENIPDIKGHKIGLTLIEVPDRKHRQQVFSDINATPKPASRSQALEFDHATPSVQMAKRLRDAVPIFSLLSEKNKERNTPGMGAIINLNGLHQTVEQSLKFLHIIPISRVDDPLEYMIAYWAAISEVIYPWQLLLSLAKDGIDPKKVKEFKRTTFAFSGVAIQSLTELFCYRAENIHAKRHQWYKDSRNDRLSLLTKAFTAMLAPMAEVDFCLDADNDYLSKEILAIKKTGEEEAVILASPRSKVLQLLSSDFLTRV